MADDIDDISNKNCWLASKVGLLSFGAISMVHISVTYRNEWNMIRSLMESNRKEKSSINSRCFLKEMFHPWRLDGNWPRHSLVRWGPWIASPRRRRWSAVSVRSPFEIPQPKGKIPQKTHAPWFGQGFEMCIGHVRSPNSLTIICFTICFLDSLISESPRCFWLLQWLHLFMC